MSEERDLRLEIGKTIGSPINTKLPVPVELQAIANIETAEAGDHVWKFSALDNTADVILDVAGDGTITVKKRSPVGDVELTFKGLNSKLEHVYVDDILNSTDLKALGRRKGSISRGMDKTELKLILDAIVNETAGYHPGEYASEITVASADDLYDVILAMKHAIEDYGDNFVLLAGTKVKEKIDTYDKDNASTFNYNVTLTAKLRELGIEVIKIFGQVSNVTGETESKLLDENKMILVAKNSRIASGKPITFVRRIIPADMAALMGADVDNLERALIIDKTPVIDTGVNKLAYGVYGYESVIFAIDNPKAIAYADATVIL